MRPLRVNGLELRLARTEREVEASQALRFQVFYEEMGARPSARAIACQRDIDQFDQYCDHLLVLDSERGSAQDPCVVGSYRLLRDDMARHGSGFYSQNEFNLERLIGHHGNVLELGRSCVDRAYRSRGTIQLLWRGLAQYIFDNRIRYMFGCASFPGTDPAAVKLALAYLYHYHLAPADIRTYAREGQSINMNTMNKDRIDTRKVFRELPPLIKGYLRVGSQVGDGAVIDRQFNTIITHIIIDTENITRKYLDHYGSHADDVSAYYCVDAPTATNDTLAPCA